MTRPPEDELLPDSLLPLPPPQAVRAIAPAMPVAISAAWRLLNFTCDASLVPRARGERTGRSTPGLGCLAVASMEKAIRAGSWPPPNVGATLGTRSEKRPRPTPICDLGSRLPRQAQLPLAPRLPTGPLAVAAPRVRRPFGAEEESSRVSGEAVGVPERCLRTRGGLPMSGVDKMKNKAQELSGEGKESLGEATDNRDLQAEGTKDKVAGNLKQAGEKVKDAFK